MKVFSKYKMTLNAIRKTLDGLKDFETYDWVQVSEGQPKTECEQNNLFYLEEWFEEEENLTGVKKLIVDIEELIKEYDDANQG